MKTDWSFDSGVSIIILDVSFDWSLVALYRLTHALSTAVERMEQSIEISSNASYVELPAETTDQISVRR